MSSRQQLWVGCTSDDSRGAAALAPVVPQDTLQTTTNTCCNVCVWPPPSPCDESVVLVGASTHSCGGAHCPCHAPAGCTIFRQQQRQQQLRCSAYAAVVVVLMMQSMAVFYSHWTQWCVPLVLGVSIIHSPLKSWPPPTGAKA